MADAAENRDGNYWNLLTMNEKLACVTGFFDGLVYAEHVFDIANLMAQADPKTKLWNLERARILVDFGKIASKQLDHDFRNLTAGQLMTGLDKIYFDYRNSRIVVREAIIVVVRSMDGTADDEITKLLERKRSEASH
jgi:hypothetical protein